MPADLLMWIWLGGWALLLVGGVVEDAINRQAGTATGLVLALGAMWPLAVVFALPTVLADHVVYPWLQRRRAGGAGR